MRSWLAALLVILLYIGLLVWLDQRDDAPLPLVIPANDPARK